MSKKARFDQKRNDNKVYMFAGIAIALIIAIAAFVSLGGNDSNSPNTTTSSGSSTGGQTVKEVTITPTVTKDKIIIKKAEVEQNKIVRFEYEPVKLTLKNGSQVAFPLMAYVSPSNELKVAIRMCEPCNGLTFSTVDGKILNCDTCGTQWDLQTNQWNGVGAQACGSYPPEIIQNAKINGDNIEININDFKDWMPRA